MYLLLFFIPKANPDFEPLFPLIRRWYLELDENDRAVREIGLDEEGKPITAGPWGKNFGFWTDSGEPVPKEWVQELSQTIFEDAWSLFKETESGV